ncbi:pseudouridine synthase [Roseibacillus ishigakijimensis]|uniref:Pseudouridine synthase n=1 Tax=Roseibacillus ishigakijimensis TaxID=454146 RepID=A0A934RMY7_9BACT|nr:16S rRNA pseudouridine(516) synthase [Roseibacillus ishigakijimensis]MBK1834359.1 16S rRNA pseudouridine(516) synthase [Roseibacillus ishigakijimensis]
MRLDRVIAKWARWGSREVRLRLARGEVEVNGSPVHEGSWQVNGFDRITWAGRVVQHRVPRHVLLHKPEGVVSATRDEQHKTVVDLIKEPWARELHLGGRLDRFTTGLLILSNDSTVTEALTRPERKLGKRYRVTCESAITPEMMAVLEQGMWFAKEQIMTQPARVEKISRECCRLTIYEGKHHQVKRMFARFGVKVIALHREAIGPLELPANLEPGSWRLLREEELRFLHAEP